MVERRLLVLYGSQTGCAEEVAEHVAREAAARRLSPILMSMDEYDVRTLPAETHCVFVCSTTGQGDAPDSMRAFWSFLLRKSLPADSLSACKYATFGLGDSSYAKFNATAKRLDRRLESLGGQRLVPLGLGDDQDANGYDEALDPWLDALWGELLKLFPLAPGTQIDDTRSLPPPRYLITRVTSAPPAPAPPGEGPWGPDRPFASRVAESRALTGEGAEKEVRHFELDVEGSGLAFRAGDSVAIQPRNRPEDVEAFARELGLDAATLIDVRPAPPPADGGAVLRAREPVGGWGVRSVGEVLAAHCDVMGTPRRYFFHLLYFFCPDATQRERLEEFASVAGRDDLYHYCQKQGRSFLEVFRDFPTARPPLEYLLDLVPRLQPRSYSISSAPSRSASRLSVTASIVRYESKTKMQRHGVCTSFLKTCGAAPSGGSVPIWIRPGSLALPKPKGVVGGGGGAAQWLAVLEPPLIMVGPGTGLAPLRSFVQERAHARAALRGAGAEPPASRDLLFFGCRTSAMDFLYKEELEGYAASGDLALLSVAFSRDQAKKVYVQHKVREEGSALWRALEGGAVVMVCGSSDKMPADVRKAIVGVVAGEGGRGEEEAEGYVRELERQRRYLLDTWS